MLIFCLRWCLSTFSSSAHFVTLHSSLITIFESTRRKFSFFTRWLDSTSTKKQAFNLIQFALFRSRCLIHVDIERQLYDDVDVSKEFEIDVMIYHVKNDSIYDVNDSTTWYSSRSKIQLILFLNRSLKSIERNYWSIELKIAEIVFIIRKIRHLIESFKKSIILFIDHESALRIIKQISLLITFIDKLNLRLVKVFEYIQRFNLIIKHKSDKQHIVLNVLSRLANANNENAFESKEFDVLIAFFSRFNIMKLDVLFIIILIEMNDEFRTKIINEYFIDSK
jgi:hypothetical protein